MTQNKEKIDMTAEEKASTAAMPLSLPVNDPEQTSIQEYIELLLRYNKHKKESLFELYSTLSPQLLEGHALPIYLWMHDLDMPSDDGELQQEIVRSKQFIRQTFTDYYLLIKSFSTLAGIMETIPPIVAMFGLAKSDSPAWNTLIYSSIALAFTVITLCYRQAYEKSFFNFFYERYQEKQQLLGIDQSRAKSTYQLIKLVAITAVSGYGCLANFDLTLIRLVSFNIAHGWGKDLSDIPPVLIATETILSFLFLCAVWILFYNSIKKVWDQVANCLQQSPTWIGQLTNRYRRLETTEEPDSEADDPPPKTTLNWDTAYHGSKILVITASLLSYYAAIYSPDPNRSLDLSFGISVLGVIYHSLAANVLSPFAPAYDFLFKLTFQIGSCLLIAFSSEAYLSLFVESQLQLYKQLVKANFGRLANYASHSNAEAKHAGYVLTHVIFWSIAMSLYEDLPTKLNNLCYQNAKDRCEMVKDMIKSLINTLCSPITTFIAAAENIYTYAARYSNKPSAEKLRAELKAALNDYPTWRKSTLSIILAFIFLKGMISTLPWGFVIGFLTSCFIKNSNHSGCGGDVFELSDRLYRMMIPHSDSYRAMNLENSSSASTELLLPLSRDSETKNPENNGLQPADQTNMPPEKRCSTTASL